MASPFGLRPRIKVSSDLPARACSMFTLILILEPIIAGGTGSASESLDMPTHYPDRLEPGTQNPAAIAALAAGLQFIRDAGVERINAHEQNLLKRFCSIGVL